MIINDRSRESDLRGTIFLQVDNSSRENKINFWLGYIRYVLVMSEFRTVETSFLYA